jgi:hypothetical protein
MGNVNAQNEYPSNGELEKTRIVNKKKFRVLYEEVQIDASIDAVWNEIAGNFGKGESIAASMNESRGLTGDLITGLGAERYLNINFQGSTIEVKERIIDFKDCGDQREYTYDVYESKGTPLRIKTYNSWYVRKGEDGNTYLGSAFIFRPNLGFLTGLIGKKLAQSGSIRTGLLSVKHYLETGEKKVAADKLDKLYPL